MQISSWLTNDDDGEDSDVGQPQAFGPEPLAPPDEENREETRQDQPLLGEVSGHGLSNTSAGAQDESRRGWRSILKFFGAASSRQRRESTSRAPEVPPHQQVDTSGLLDSAAPSPAPRPPPARDDRLPRSPPLLLSILRAGEGLAASLPIAAADGADGNAFRAGWGALTPRQGLLDEEDEGSEESDGFASFTDSFFRFSDEDAEGAAPPAASAAAEAGALFPSPRQRSAQSPGIGPRRRRPPSRRRAQLAALALIFTNFCLAVAAIALLMAGVSTETSSVVSLCTACRRLGTASLVFGSVLLFASLWGFLCLWRRHLFWLMGYAVVVALLLCGVSAVVVLAAVYDRETRFPTTTDHGYMLSMWEAAVNATFGEGGGPPDPFRGAEGEERGRGLWAVAAGEGGDLHGDGEPAVCRAQREFNCSGFHFGCCRPGVCYDLVPENESSGGRHVDAQLLSLAPAAASSSSFPDSTLSSSSSSDEHRLVPPPWVRRVCPRCPAVPDDLSAAVVCTEEVYTTVGRNMIAFLLLMLYAWALMAGGTVLACLARRAARLRRKRRLSRSARLAAAAAEEATQHQQRLRRRAVPEEARALSLS